MSIRDFVPRTRGGGPLELEALGRHLLLEYFGCDPLILDDQAQIEKCMMDAAQAAHTTPLQSVFHRFSPQGVTGVIVIAESHLSIHTWPELGYASVDFYTCGQGQPQLAKDLLSKRLAATHWEYIDVQRGLNPLGVQNRASMRCSHFNVKEYAQATPPRAVLRAGGQR